MKRMIAGMAWLVLMAAGVFGQAVVQRSSAGVEFRVQTVATGLDYPWSIAFAQDDGNGPATEVLVTLRGGKLLHIAGIDTATGPGDLGARAREVAGVPAVRTGGQGGLFDVVLAPDFGNTGRIYLSAALGSGGSGGTGLLTAVLDTGSGNVAIPRLRMVEELWRLPRFTSTQIHYGARMAFDPAGDLYLGIGERGEQRRAQDTADLAGSVLRFPATASGRVASVPEMVSWGHRNPQGMYWDRSAGVLVIHEHGPRGGDEVNVIRKGGNYGWPLVSYGINYDGSPVSSLVRKEGLEEPLVYWVPSIAPSGLARYPERGVFAPEPGKGFSGNLFAGALAGQQLRRVALPADWAERRGRLPLTEAGTIAGYREEVLLQGTHGRIRDVRIDRAGYIWFVTDAGDGGLYRLVPR